MESDLEDFQRRIPSRNELGKYINHMKDLMGRQHAYIATVAVRLYKSQQIEYESLTKHITDAFHVCHRVLTGAFQSLQDSMRQIRRDARIAVSKLDNDSAGWLQKHIEYSNDMDVLKMQMREMGLQIKMLKLSRYASCPPQR